MKTIVQLILLALLLSATEPEDLYYMTENYPPNNYLDEYGILQGASVEIVKAIWKEMGVSEQEIRVYPWARAYQNAVFQKEQVLFTMSRSSARIPLFKWVGPISSSRHLVVGYAPDSSARHTIPALVALKSGFRIAVVNGDVGEALLLEAGVPASACVPTIEMKEAIKKLMVGETDLLSIGQESYKSLRRAVPDGHFYIAYVIDVSQDYIAFSKDVPDALIARFQKALDAIKKTEHQRILDRYGLQIIPEK